MTLVEKLRKGITTDSAEATQSVAEQLAGSLPPDFTLALHGDLGVGKTTFVQGLARGFGIREMVTSPTFNIYTVYHGPARTLIHFDAYRLDRPSQVEDLLVEDFLVSPWCLAVEWPDKVSGWLPPDTWHLELGITTEQHHMIRIR
jgi:tRNA threonylcarbamoyladenosine biosynthesis protein TsaE